MKVELRAQPSNVRCVLCHGDDGELETCPSCGTRFHRECRTEATKCPTLGCTLPGGIVASGAPPVAPAEREVGMHVVSRTVYTETVYSTNPERPPIGRPRFRDFLPDDFEVWPSWKSLFDFALATSLYLTTLVLYILGVK